MDPTQATTAVLRLLPLRTLAVLGLALVATGWSERAAVADPVEPAAVEDDLPRGLYALTRFAQPPREPTWDTDFVDGLVIRTYWRSLYVDEGAREKLDWGTLDELLDKAAAKGKRVHLVVAPGFYSPEWVLRRVATANFVVPQGPLEGSVGKLPIPWDDEYLSLWWQFVEQLAERYGSRSELAYVSLTGPNSHNGEVVMPRTDIDERRWLQLAREECPNCEGKKLRQQWFAWRMLQAYEWTAEVYDQAFGSRNRHYTLALVQQPLPLTNRDLQRWYWDELSGLGATRPYLGLQTNGMDGRDLCPAREGRIPEHWKVVEDHAARGLTGFQTEFTGNLFNCDLDADGKVSREEKRAILGKTIENTLDHGGRFLEVYEPLVLDPAMEDLLRYARARLLEQPGPTR